MNRNVFAALATSASLLFLCASMRPPAPHASSPPRALQLALSFEQNLGQAAPDARFLARGPGYSVRIGENAARLRLEHGGASDAVSLQFQGARNAAPLAALEPLPGRSNYYRGSDPARWIAGVPHYGRVRQAGVYPGIDLEYHGDGAQLEFDFVVAAGADPAAIRLRFGGARKVALEADGSLALALEHGALSQHAPVAYQERDGRRSTVAAQYLALADGSYGLALGDYDRTRQLIIDPTLEWSVYVGGNGADLLADATLDTDGNVFLAGSTTSDDFPEATDTLQGSRDGFVAKISADGNTLLYATYLGGSGDDVAKAVRVTAAGIAHVLGATRSSNLPTTGNAADNEQGTGEDSSYDAFIARLDNDGALIYLTYFGGGGDEIGDSGDVSAVLNAVARLSVDSDGEDYFIGRTKSTDLDATANAIRNSLSGASDLFVAKLDADGSAFSLVSYLGSDGADDPVDLALDDSDRAFILGNYTGATTFPSSNGAAQDAIGSAADAFVIAVNTTTSAQIYSTPLGGSGIDTGAALITDGNGNVFVAGRTESADLPEIQNFQPPVRTKQLVIGGAADGFLVELDETGNTRWGTYLGGSAEDAARGVALIPAAAGGGVLVVGQTFSENFPVSAGAFQAGVNGADDLFVANFDADGTRRYATLVGGTGADHQGFVRSAPDGSAVVLAQTASANFPVTAGSFNDGCGSGDFALALFHVNLGGSALSSSSCFGSSGSDTPVALALTADGAGALAAGFTDAADFPTLRTGNTEARASFHLKAGATSTGSGGGIDAVAAMFGLGAAPPAGAIAFTSATFSVAEGAGTATITATRTGGTAGAASVTFASANGSAIDGVDYAAADGTLNWANGEGGTRSFTVPIIDDTTSEPAETVNLTLSAATGATLGAPAAAVLTITDNDGGPVTGTSGAGALGGLLLIPLALLALLRRRAHLALALAATLLCLPAQALKLEEKLSHPYVSVRGGATRFTQTGEVLGPQLRARGFNVSASVDTRGTGYAVWAGYPVARFTFLEIGYADLGQYDASAAGPDQGAPGLPLALAQSLDSSGQAVLIGVAQKLPICERLWLHPHVALMYYQSTQEARAGGIVVQDKDSGRGVNMGADVMYDLGRGFAIGAGAETFNAKQSKALWLFSGQLEYRFGQ